MLPPAWRTIDVKGGHSVMLSARDVEEALKERLLRGAYPRGGALPSVRALAAELGTSPSTVGRAVQELARQGWVTATSRRGAVVRRDLPAGETGVRDAEAAIRRLAVRWRLVGGDRAEFQELVARVADEVFQPAPRTLFLECNPVDLQRGLEQVQRETSVNVEPLLLEDAADGSGELLKDANVLLTPYFHLAEARELAPEGAQVVPLNFVASQDALRALVELPADTLVGVVAVDARSRRRLEAIVQQYSAASTVLGALLDDSEAAVNLVEAADLVLVTNAANLPGHLAARARRVVRVGWTLERGGLGGWRVSAEPSSGPE
jgi:DNA-binding transcriptional regulator YhcF (GntR family)